MNKKDQLACQTLAYHALNQDGVSLAKTTHFPGEKAERFDPNATYVDVVASVAPGASRQAFIGSETDYRTRGALIIQLRVPATAAIAGVMEKVDAIVRHILQNRTFKNTDMADRPDGWEDIAFETPTAVRSGAIRTHRLITVTTPWQSWRQAEAA